MRTSDLLLSSLNITEDDYSYKGQFILSSGSQSRLVDMSELENDESVLQLKTFFNLEESIEEIRKSLMDTVFEKASISSVIVEGENYEEKAKRKVTERRASSFDLA